MISDCRSKAYDIASSSICGAILALVAATASSQTITVYAPPGAPLSGLTMDSQGNFYGATGYGGKFGYGTVFEITPSGSETVLHNFQRWACSGPGGALALDSTGSIYGICDEPVRGHFQGVFMLKDAKDGKEKETVLYQFTEVSEGYADASGLIMDAAGNLYGTTIYGGAYGGGTVFQITPNGTEIVLHSFFQEQDGYATDPAPGLILDAQGNLYGTTMYGGPYRCGNGGIYTCGTVYEVSQAGEEKVLYAFKGGTDGFFPAGSLLLDTKGNLYGTTWYGGEFGYGTVFKLNRAGSAGKEKILYSFTGGADGGSPITNVIQDAKGNLYGTTSGGGEYGQGTVFKSTPDGTEKVLYSFSGYLEGGAYPSGLVFDNEGNLWGTTSDTIFKLTID